jgi:hypothetical protein
VKLGIIASKTVIDTARLPLNAAFYLEAEPGESVEQFAHRRQVESRTAHIRKLVNSLARLDAGAADELRRSL